MKVSTEVVCVPPSLGVIHSIGLLREAHPGHKSLQHRKETIHDEIFKSSREQLPLSECPMLPRF